MDGAKKQSAVGVAGPVVSKALNATECVLIAVSATAPAVVTVVFVSSVGFGAEINRWVTERAAVVRAAVIAAVILLFLMKALATRLWHGVPRLLAVLLSLLSWGTLGAATMLGCNEYPVLPIIFFVMMSPIWLLRATEFAIRLRHSAVVEEHTLMITQSLRLGLFVSMASCLVVWTSWMFATDSEWWRAQHRLAASAGCPPPPPGVHGVCQKAWVFWAAPGISAVNNMLLIVVLSAAIADLKHICRSTKVLQDAPLQRSDDVHGMSLMRMTGMAVTLVAVALYANTCISAGSADVTNRVGSIAIIATAMLGTVTALLFSMAKIDAIASTAANPIILRLHGAFGSLWCKGAVVLLGSPLFAIYVGYLRSHSWIQRGMLSRDNHEKLQAELLEERRKASLTRSGSPRQGSAREASPRKSSPETGLEKNAFAAALTLWPWTGVLQHAILVGIILMTLQVVVAKVVTLFLSWLNSYLASFALPLVIVIFFFIGISLFLAPPIPGVPVYLAGGVIITSQAQIAGMGFWEGALLSSVVCYGIKLVAIVMQQKGIGEQLGKYVYIRYVVGVNSLVMRAVKLILEKPGMDFPTVCILCGGPDWPTSVCTGILGLSLKEMLMGSLPVFFVILPTCLAGALQLRVAEGGHWETYASLMLAGCALVQFLAALGAFYFVEQTGLKRLKELEGMEDDQEVAAMEEVQEQKRRALVEATEWARVPWLMRIVLVVAAVCMSLSCSIVYLFPQDCFVPFQVTNAIEETLGGNALTIVKPLGSAALALFGASIALRVVFGSWASGALQLRNIAAKAAGVGKVGTPTKADAVKVVRKSSLRVVV
jgi:hypothetical protein